MAYDGTTPLKKAVADLIGCSPKNNNKLAHIVGQAKDALNITSKARKLPTETNQQIYSYIVELYSQTKVDTVEINSQPKVYPVEIYSHTANFKSVRIAFYVTHKGEKKRQVIALDGFFINALSSIGISKQDTPKWIQAQVDEWTAFDSQLPNTQQVKYLIMREVVKGLSGSDAVFHPTN